MDRIEKFLEKLDGSTLRRVKAAIAFILIGDTEKLDIQPLHGCDGCYRCRIGNVRIVYRKFFGHLYGIVDIGLRKDVYKRLKRSV